MSHVVWVSLQFNIVPDEGSEEGFREVQFNDMLVE
jgi:hypothetical protein